MRRIRAPRDVGIGGRLGVVLMAVSLSTLAVTAFVDFVIWPLILGRTSSRAVDVLAVTLGFGGAVVVCTTASVVLAARLSRSVGRLSGAVRQVADGRTGVRVAPLSLGPEADDLVRAFNEMATKLESTDLSQRRLLADLAHEIRTPVSVLDGYLEAIQDGVVRPDEETLTMLRGQTTRLARLTDDVLSVSHAEDGRLNLEPAAVEVSDLVQSAARAAWKSYSDKGVELRVRTAPEDVRVHGDRQRLDQVLANLLTNALRHSVSGGSVEIGVSAAGQRRVRIAVTDRGDGIDAEHLPWIFERFYRTDVARDRDHGGSGVGLTISRAIVTAHGGHLWVESEGAGRGATFAFTLPTM
ncbi:cell wall metabolism sensor histidine kinase WalK [Tsukamurella sp. 1534]|uniref:sensor histidine kinase n=1 Tax=Tsukamurella sp. 1534 TaxID=1151061 RepID=UPI000317704D|nr:HAMP domain-containing sensor histidine kinase [Tsukamurella sp. 1534]